VEDQEKRNFVKSGSSKAMEMLRSFKSVDPTISSMEMLGTTTPASPSVHVSGAVGSCPVDEPEREGRAGFVKNGSFRTLRDSSGFGLARSRQGSPASASRILELFAEASAANPAPRPCLGPVVAYAPLEACEQVQEFFGLHNNAVRREAADLWRLLERMTATPGAPPKVAVADAFYQWVDFFEEFVVDEFHMKEGVVFPWLREQLALDAIPEEFSASALQDAFGGVFETINDIRGRKMHLLSKSGGAALSSAIVASFRKALTDLLAYFVLEETTLAALAQELPLRGLRVRLVSHVRTMKGAERFVPLVTRCLSETQTTIWLGEYLKMRKGQFASWNKVARSHFELVESRS